MKTRIVIFSSAEDVKLAEALQRKFYHKDFTVNVWTNGFFKLSRTYIENFTNIKYHYDFAVVIYGADDFILRRGKRIPAARDNVVLELGMCIEAFSLQRTIIVQKNDTSLPTDLSGVQTIGCSVGELDDLDAVAGALHAQAVGHIERYLANDDTLSWEELFIHTKMIIRQLRKSEGAGGYFFDVVVGINRGGLVVADLIAREFGLDKPTLSLFADKRTGYPCFDSADFHIINEGIVNILKDERFNNILLVDSLTRDGQSIVEAKKFLVRHLPEKKIKRMKVAVIYINEKLKDKNCVKAIDFFSCYKQLDGKQLSLDRLGAYSNMIRSENVGKIG